MEDADQRLDLRDVERRLSVPISEATSPTAARADNRDGRVFLADADLRLSVRVALATGRPLLLRGLPGTGKSSVAAFIAERLRWRYYERVMTSESTANDVLWTYDAVRRLADAQTAGARAVGLDEQARVALTELPAFDYVEPGPLWWAQSPASAARRGAPPGRLPANPATPPTLLATDRDPKAAVVLIDEIDKAGPEVPNALLVPLGSQTFVVEPTGERITAEPDCRLLLVITTNDERDLPRAFIRRCVVHTVPLPDAPRMVEIAVAHAEGRGQPLSEDEVVLCTSVAGKVEALQGEMKRNRQRPPGTAEFLDAWETARQLEIDTESALWSFVEQATLRKEFPDLLEEGSGTA